jgi:hypothetical protein
MYLNEANLLNNIRLRYKKDIIYVRYIILENQLRIYPKEILKWI